MNTPLVTAALSGAESLINAALQLDPGTRLALGRLQGQVLAVTLTAPALTIYILPDEQGVQLAGYWEGEVHTHLHGSLPALIQLACNPDHSLADSGVSVVGSTALLVELQKILGQLDLDWEDMLTRTLGNIAGHQSAEWLRSGWRWSQSRTQDLQRLLSEFLTEESATLAGRPELESFYRDIDELRLAADRLEARLHQWLKKVQTPPE